MNIFLILSLFVCSEAYLFGNSYSNNLKTPIPANYSVKWYSQKVDHFSYANEDRFKQRYIISLDHWCDDCPIFFYAGNEGDIFMFANNTGFMWENAQAFNAMVIFVEHRYYGESMPYGKQSFKNLTNLGFLTTEQALADYAQFIDYIKESIPNAKKSPVIVFGGSYGGMLASWFRMKYPHLAIGALAGSAPILQFPGIYDCSGYFDIITNDFKKYSQQCSQTIRNSWDAVRRLAKTDEGLKWLTETFVLCESLKVSDTNAFITWLSSTWESLAMIDYPNAASFLQPLPAYPIGVTCNYMKNPNQSDKPLLEDVFRAASVYYNYTGMTKCNDISQQSQSLGLDGWSFQACTEMVLPVCSNGVTDMFENNPWNFTEYSQNCHKQYGVYSESEKAIMMFGGRDITTATNIIFSNGLRDPWSAGGVLQSLSESLIAIQIPNACHHEDLRPSGPNDPPELKEARNQEISIIKTWINDYYNKINYYPLNLNLKNLFFNLNK